MKQVPALVILFFILSIFMVSCQKEVNGNNNVLPNTSDSIYLDKIYEVYDAGSGLDTQNISVCRYDNLNRLTAINDSFYIDGFANWTFSYYGTDTLPYKSTYSYISDPLHSDSEAVYHYYDASQRKLKDSIIIAFDYGTTIQLEVVNYSYGNSKMYGDSYHMGILPSSSPVYYKDTASFDGNGNIINSRNYMLSGTDYVLNRTSDFTYDNHSNPFSKLNIWKSFSRFPNGETLFWEIMCSNNIVSQNEVTLPPNQYTFDPVYSYTYLQNGLPSTSISPGPNSNTDTEIYTYKSR